MNNLLQTVHGLLSDEERGNCAGLSVLWQQECDYCEIQVFVLVANNWVY